jgi:CRP-like cAMP-binding protein
MKPMGITTESQSRNHLLAELPADDYQRLVPHLNVIDLPHGKVIYDTGDRIDDVYFPFNALISLVKGMSDGKVVEVGLIGSDGMSGLAGLLGGGVSSERAIVQIPDGAVRAKMAVVREEFRRGGSLQNILLAYLNRLMHQISQTAACNAIHTAEERLARWFLMCQDRVESEELNLTQEFIAEMIGTRRATVTAAALTLQSAQLIQYNRGRIRIVDRSGLQAFACECYQPIQVS